MKQLNKIFKKNPLRFTLILSCLLHLIGFYCLSSLSHYLPVKKAELVPVKIKIIVEKEKIKSAKVTPKETTNEYLDIKASQLHPPQESTISLKNRSAVSARSVHFTASSFRSFSPTKLYREPSQTISKTNNLPIHAKDTPISTTINFIKNTTPVSLHVRTINLNSSSPIVLQKREPAHPENYYNNYVNNPMTVSKNFISNRLEKKSKLLHTRSTSNFHASATLTHSPSSLVTTKISRPHFDAKPKIRMASLASGFSEEYFGASKITPDLTSNSPNDEQVSTFELGRLRKGFVNQVRSNITKAKYYPRIARKHGFEGKPIVVFALGHKGELINLLLAQPSDHKVLNDAALETIRRGAPYPPIPDQLKEKSINFKLPILYILGEH